MENDRDVFTRAMRVDLTLHVAEVNSKVLGVVVWLCTSREGCVSGIYTPISSTLPL